MVIAKIFNSAICPVRASSCLNSLLGMVQLNVLWPLHRLVVSASSASQILFTIGSFVLLSLARKRPGFIVNQFRGN